MRQLPRCERRLRMGSVDTLTTDIIGAVASPSRFGNSRRRAKALYQSIPCTDFSKYLHEAACLQ